MTIALVGNGSSLKRLKKGAEIDAHDIVIRMNLFYKFLDPEITGTKVDIWACCFNWVGMYLEKPSIEIPSIWVTRPAHWDGSVSESANWRIPDWAKPRIKFELGDEGYSISEKMVRALGGKNPTTGFNALYIADKLFPSVGKDLYGFDFYEPNNYYYTEDAITFPVKHHHSPEIEKILIMDGVKEGKYRWIN